MDMTIKNILTTKCSYMGIEDHPKVESRYTYKGKDHPTARNKRQEHRPSVLSLVQSGVQLNIMQVNT